MIYNPIIPDYPVIPAPTPSFQRKLESSPSREKEAVLTVKKQLLFKGLNWMPEALWHDGDM